MTLFLLTVRAWQRSKCQHHEHTQPDKAGPVAPMELHNRIEAMKLAYTDLYRYNADPRFPECQFKDAFGGLRPAARRSDRSGKG